MTNMPDRRRGDQFATAMESDWQGRSAASSLCMNMALNLRFSAMSILASPTLGLWRRRRRRSFQTVHDAVCVCVSCFSRLTEQACSID